ncbi:MAG: glycoside hydrolase family 16 protein, partial [Bacteroidota bacterium]|nr:glycoside hydrolase family 16 protein [Bacteroidota bacterium]
MIRILVFPVLLMIPFLLCSQSKQRQLIWFDEFNYQGLPDSSKWGFETGGDGWGNHELQYYTGKEGNNAIVANGVLKITARNQVVGNNRFTSARLVTRGKVDFTYGKIEIRAKLPAGKGLWPAIWMLGSNIGQIPWPACGEIDIMEHVGYLKDSVFGTIHTEAYNHRKGTQKGNSLFVKDLYDSFHKYAIEWTPDSIQFLMDDKVYYSFQNRKLSSKEWPFSQPFFLIF